MARDLKTHRCVCFIAKIIHGSLRYVSYEVDHMTYLMMGKLRYESV